MNIKIGEIIIENVEITDSADLLGIKFLTTMRLSELETLFSPGSSPEFRIINQQGEIVGVYKNRKQISLNITNLGEVNEVNIALQVTPAKIEEVETLTTELSENTMAIAELGEIAANQEVRAGETDDALAELGILYSDLLERVIALENVNKATTDSEAIVEETAAAE